MIAHRGACLDAPENSVEAIRRAAEVGADWVELDLREAADGNIVLVHDETLEELPVVDSTLQELRAARDSIATLEEAIEAADGLGINLEIKAHRNADSFFARVATHIQGFGGSILVSSFWWKILERAARYLPGIPIGVLSAHAFDPDGIRALDFAMQEGFDAVLPQDAAIGQELIGAAHSAGLKVFSWTVDSPERIAQLAGWGIDGVITNDPGGARKALDTN